MISSGRCHGPGCTQTAVVDFCSERCAQAWNEAAEKPPAPTRRICARCQRGDCPEPMAFWEAELLAGIGAKMVCSLPTSEPEAGAAYPQVASNPDPERGWLARVFDRLFGRTT